MNQKLKKPQIIPNIFMVLFSVIIIFPFLLVVSTSLSSEADISRYGYALIPKNLDFSAYEYVFENPKMILNAYRVTFIFSVLTTVFGVLLMSFLAYPLTRKNLKGRKQISFIIYFTMLFSGGLVPSYILNTQYLHLNDTIWIYIIPALISPWYVFMMRSFFSELPGEVIESALIDGAGEYKILLRIIYPMSTPVLAVVALFTFLGKWNDWNTAMLYINKEELVSLQYLLQRIMNNIKVLTDERVASMGVNLTSEIPTESVRMAMAVVVAGPALVVFPFFQKYFVSGLTVGSVKG